jgi:hypothetical protein
MWEQEDRFHSSSRRQDRVLKDFNSTHNKWVYLILLILILKKKKKNEKAKNSELNGSMVL